jgi:methylated-DNA-[protein]-cysteine S-methyltransferase
LASSLGCKSAQAIGAAVGHNPLTLIIPCHRVVGTNGSLTGYAGGIDKKVQLLQLEGALMHDLKAIPHTDKWEFNQLLISNILHL